MNQLTGKVLITGGAGFLARAIYRRAKREGWPAEFTAVSRDDHKHAALARRFPEVRTIRGDVAGDRDHLAALFRGHDLIIHAAANKHVDLSEHQVLATMATNVEGSINVGWAAVRAGVPSVLGISTDKACEPYSTYGLSKAAMERAFQEFDTVSDTSFRLTRYGNVVASTGSVLTLFREQVEKHGQLLLTDPEMTRFWMTADDAVDAVLRALRGPSGSTWIPACGAMTLEELAKCAAPDAKVSIVGARAGEKPHETLVGALERPRAIPEAHGLKVAGWDLRAMSSLWRFGYPPFEPYTSAKPHRWWTCEEMTAAIADSEEV